MPQKLDHNIRSCGLVIIRRLKKRSRGYEILLMHRLHEKGVDHWIPPKGHKKIRDRSDQDIALREVRDECGFRYYDLILHYGAEYNTSYRVHEDDEGGYDIKDVTYWLAELKDPEKKVSLSKKSYVDFTWLSLQEALEKMRGYDEMCDMLKQFDAYIARNIL